MELVLSVKRRMVVIRNRLSGVLVVDGNLRRGDQPFAVHGVAG